MKHNIIVHTSWLCIFMATIIVSSCATNISRDFQEPYDYSRVTRNDGLSNLIRVLKVRVVSNQLVQVEIENTAKFDVVVPARAHFGLNTAGISIGYDQTIGISDETKISNYVICPGEKLTYNILLYGSVVNTRTISKIKSLHFYCLRVVGATDIRSIDARYEYINVNVGDDVLANCTYDNLKQQ